MRKRRSEKSREREKQNAKNRRYPRHSGGHRELPRLIPGRIVYINRAHRWFLVEADLGDGVTVREGFKF